MGYLYKLITIPKEDEFHSLSFIFHSAKNNIRILRNVCFYIQNKDENKEQVEDVKKISNILFKYYFEFFYYEIESQFIDEPLKVEALIKNHIKEIVAVNDSLTQDIENFKPNDLLKTAITELQKIIKEVTEQLYIFTPDFEKQTFNTIPPKEVTNPFNTEQQKHIFDYLNTNWVNLKPIRYAYIYVFMTDEINLKIDFTTYNKFIISKYGKKVQRGNATRKNNYEQLRELMEEYDN